MVTEGYAGDLLDGQAVGTSVSVWPMAYNQWTALVRHERSLAEEVGSFRLLLIWWAKASFATEYQRAEYQRARAALLAEAAKGLIDLPDFIADCPKIWTPRMFSLRGRSKPSASSRSLHRRATRPLEKRLQADWLWVKRNSIAQRSP